MCCVSGVGMCCGRHTGYSGTTRQCTINTVLDTVAYATHSGVATQLNVKRKYTTHWYTKITAVHNIHSSTQHMHDIETFGLPEGQVTSTMISVLILSSTLTSQC